MSVFFFLFWGVLWFPHTSQYAKLTLGVNVCSWCTYSCLTSCIPRTHSGATVTLPHAYWRISKTLHETMEKDPTFLQVECNHKPKNHVIIAWFNLCEAGSSVWNIKFALFHKENLPWGSWWSHFYVDEAPSFLFMYLFVFIYFCKNRHIFNK